MLLFANGRNILQHTTFTHTFSSLYTSRANSSDFFLLFRFNVSFWTVSKHPKPRSIEEWWKRWWGHVIMYTCICCAFFVRIRFCLFGLVAYSMTFAMQYCILSRCKKEKKRRKVNEKAKRERVAEKHFECTTFDWYCVESFSLYFYMYIGIAILTRLCTGRMNGNGKMYYTTVKLGKRI